MRLARELLPAYEAEQFETITVQVAAALEVTHRRTARMLAAAGVDARDVELLLDMQVDRIVEAARSAMHLGLWEGEWR